MSTYAPPNAATIKTLRSIAYQSRKSGTVGQERFNMVHQGRLLRRGLILHHPVGGTYDNDHISVTPQGHQLLTTQGPAR